MDVVLTAVLTCPHCGHATRETMPTDACVYFHTCSACGARLTPKTGDCCVFCSYADVRCPPKQQDETCCTGGADMPGKFASAHGGELGQDARQPASQAPQHSAAKVRRPAASDGSLQSGKANRGHP